MVAPIVVALRTSLLLLGAVLLGGACALSASGPAATGPSGHGSSANAGVSASGGPSAAPSASAVSAEGGGAPEDLIAAKNRECERCHVEVAGEWRGSLHHLAWDDPVFLTAYAIEPLGFCRECHVPEANPFESAPPAALRRLGIGCVTCHVEGGAITGVTSLAGSKEGHPVVGDAKFATVAACARCHEFDFPEKQKALMQSTVTEHASSPHKAAPCRDCHMPLVEATGKKPHRSHDFRVIGNAALLRSAVTASAARDADDPKTVVVTLAAARIGHDFPTGDMFRRVTVRARVLGGEGESQAARPVVLAREFDMVPGKQGIMRKQTADKRLPASGEAREVELLFPVEVSRRAVRWEVVYQRMGDSMARLFGVDPDKDEVIVAEGTLPAAVSPSGKLPLTATAPSGKLPPSAVSPSAGLPPSVVSPSARPPLSAAPP